MIFLLKTRAMKTRLETIDGILLEGDSVRVTNNVRDH